MRRAAKYPRDQQHHRAERDEGLQQRRESTRIDVDGLGEFTLHRHYARMDAVDLFAPGIRFAAGGTAGGNPRLNVLLERQIALELPVRLGPHAQGLLPCGDELHGPEQPDHAIDVRGIIAARTHAVAGKGVVRTRLQQFDAGSVIAVPDADGQLEFREPGGARRARVAQHGRVSVALGLDPLHIARDVGAHGRQCRNAAHGNHQHQQHAGQQRPGDGDHAVACFLTMCIHMWMSDGPAVLGKRSLMKIARHHQQIAEQLRQIGQFLRDHVQHAALPAAAYPAPKAAAIPAMLDAAPPQRAPTGSNSHNPFRLPG